MKNLIKEAIFLFGLTMLMLLILHCMLYFFSIEAVVLVNLAWLFAKNFQHSWYTFNQKETKKEA